jgi:ABC-type Fe3+/spermidine/putrescine transport system ATPase subunit
VVRPGTLLLDEPLSNLDANLREQMRFEIRRVHHETGISMVYVTHDQSEAMVIADRIAVLNAGRVEQVGTPRDIYERPLSRFVASFIGRANCLSARGVEPGVVEIGDRRFVVDDGLHVRTGADVTLAIRPSAVRVVRDDAAAPAQNVIRGRLVSQAYLGDQLDLRFELNAETTIRALASSAEQVNVGGEVLLYFPAADCRVVTS